MASPRLSNAALVDGENFDLVVARQDNITRGSADRLRPLHLVVRETEFCGLRLAADFRRRTRENGRNSVRRPRHASLTDRNCEGF